MHVKLPNKSEQKAIWIDKKWFILVQYRRYNSSTLSPLPRWKVDQNIGILFLMSLSQNFHRITRIPCTLFLWYKNMITRKWVKRFVNERMFSAVWHIGLLCFGFYVQKVYVPFQDLLDELSIRNPDKRFQISRLSWANRVFLTLAPSVPKLQCTITDVLVSVRIR